MADKKTKVLSCSRCDYTWRSKTLANTSGLCRKCYRKEHRESEAGKDSFWRAWLKYRYGLTPAQYDEMLTRQDGVCAICRMGNSAYDRLHVDHDDRTGKIRGLLCNNCNRGIGHLKDSIPNLRAAIRYLKDAAESPAVPKGGQ